MTNIFGHKIQKEILNAHLKNNNIFPAYLFLGPAMIGKKSLALAFAQALGAKILPDLAVFDFNPYTQNPFTVKLFKEAKKQFYLKPSHGRRKFIIFDNFEYSTEIIQNALLKIVEEPPPQTVFIFISQSDFILQTLLSRAFKIKFSPLSDQEMREFIKQKALSIAQASLDKIIFYCSGKPGLADLFLKNQKFFQKQNIFFNYLAKLTQLSLAKRHKFFTDYFAELEDKAEVILCFDILLGMMRQLIRFRPANALLFTKEAQFLLKAKSAIIRDSGSPLKLIIDALAFQTLVE